jgi:outer membrane murein-binding lipoprotein Lpp
MTTKLLFWTFSIAVVSLLLMLLIATFKIATSIQEKTTEKNDRHATAVSELVARVAKLEAELKISSEISVNSRSLINSNPRSITVEKPGKSLDALKHKFLDLFSSFDGMYNENSSLTTVAYSVEDKIESGGFRVIEGGDFLPFKAVGVPAVTYFTKLTDRVDECRSLCVSNGTRCAVFTFTSSSKCDFYSYDSFKFVMSHHVNSSTNVTLWQKEVNGYVISQV